LKEEDKEARNEDKGKRVNFELIAKQSAYTETINPQLCHCSIQARIKKIKRKTPFPLISQHSLLPREEVRLIPKHPAVQVSMWVVPRGGLNCFFIQ